MARSNASASRCAVTSRSRSRVNGRLGVLKDFQQVELAGRQALFVAVARVDRRAPVEVERAPANMYTKLAIQYRPGALVKPLGPEIPAWIERPPRPVRPGHAAIPGFRRRGGIGRP